MDERSYVNRCFYCEADFQSSDAFADLCPRCQQLDGVIYANDPTPGVDTDTLMFSRRAMQERLGVSGERDE